MAKYKTVLNIIIRLGRMRPPRGQEKREIKLKDKRIGNPKLKKPKEIQMWYEEAGS